MQFFNSKNLSVKCYLLVQELPQKALTNYCWLRITTTNAEEPTSLVSYLEYYLGMDSRAYFLQNEVAREAISLFITRNIKTMATYKGYLIEYPLQWFFTKTPKWGVLAIFFHWYFYRNRYHVSSLKYVMKSTTKNMALTFELRECSLIVLFNWIVELKKWKQTLQQSSILKQK